MVTTAAGVRSLSKRPLGRVIAASGAILAHAGMIALVLWTPAAQQPAPHESVLTVELLSTTTTSPPQPKTPPPVRRPHREHQAHSLPQVAMTPTKVSPPALQPVIAVSTERTSTVEPPAVANAPPVAVMKSPPPADYVGLLAARLAAVKSYPVSARQRKQQGTVLLYFELNRGGAVLNWHIAHSSGYEALDAEVATMIVAASPFPPFPDSLKGASESFLVPIEFSLLRR